MALIKAKTLVLNNAYLPIRIINWMDAVTLWYKGLAEIIEEYENIQLRSWKRAMNCPCVIRLKYFTNPHKKINFVKPFTRKNIYDEFNHKCAYCGKNVSMKKFTLDHVIASSKGGVTNWQNIVCCCQSCNIKKGDKTVEEAGMKLLQKPKVPIIASNYNEGMIKRLMGIPTIMNNSKWRQYIYWNVELDQDK